MTTPERLPDRESGEPGEPGDRSPSSPVGDGRGSPIYESLIDEHGDVLTEARTLSEEIQREADHALNFAPRR